MTGKQRTDERWLTTSVYLGYLRSSYQINILALASRPTGSSVIGFSVDFHCFRPPAIDYSHQIDKEMGKP